MTTQIKMSRNWFADVMASPEVEDALRGQAQKALSAAVSAAPVSTGDYQASLQMEVDRHPGDRRPNAHVYTDHPGGHKVEDRDHVLRSAVESL
jgi:hypothetical protein